MAPMECTSTRPAAPARRTVEGPRPDEAHDTLCPAPTSDGTDAGPHFARVQEPNG